jgi:anthranilate synthase component 2
MKVAVIDNYDSFTYNLIQLLRESGKCEYTVWMNDRVDPERILAFDKILISPGPGLPHEAGKLCEVVQLAASRVPVLGICLGHQAIAYCLGGKLKQLGAILHGVDSEIIIRDKEEPLFHGLPEVIKGGRYHSWIVDPETLPDTLKITATDNMGQIMALSHTKWDLKGIQFHPESFMTYHGRTIIHNWLDC